MKRNDCKIEDFRFKQFAVSHHKSSMKVGVDAVMIGAWGEVNGKRGLDVGCGCGLIALMAAQRNPFAVIDALDIDSKSVEEAAWNFSKSIWKKRLNAVCCDINEFARQEINQAKYDFIISNPPFFRSGLYAPQSTREKARHESTLSPRILFIIGETLLAENGYISVILPADNLQELLPFITESYQIERLCMVADKPFKSPKRCMITATKTVKQSELKESVLYIRNEDGTYSKQYRQLTDDFYLWLS